MSLIIQKFGGSSVADVECIQRAARIVAKTVASGCRVVVVVSALQGETDRLINLAGSFGECDSREFAAILSTGEQISAALFSNALKALGNSAKSFNAQQLQLKTQGTYKQAQVQSLNANVLKNALLSDEIPVVTGFQGINDQGEITTLGRGGSDLTAVAIAAALEADECQIFTDVDGVYTSDPNIVPRARKLCKISFPEMLELSSLGAKVLQPRSLEYAGKHQVSVKVLSSFKDVPGTHITYDASPSEQPPISGVVFDAHQAVITIRQIPERPGLASYIFSPISQLAIDVDMIVQNCPSQHRQIDLSFTLNRDHYSEVIRVIEPVLCEMGGGYIDSSHHVAKVSIVGVGMRSHSRVASTMFRTLRQEGIDIKLITASEIKISVIIEEKFLAVATRSLHKVFNLEQNSAKIVAI